MVNINLDEALDHRLSSIRINQEEDTMTVYVGNITYSATTKDLAELFAQYGEVKKITIPQDYEKGRMRGYAFVELETEDGEDIAIKNLASAQYMGRLLKVEKANSKTGTKAKMDMMG